MQSWKIFAALLALTTSSQAAVTRFVVEQRQPYPQDAAFEVLSGHFEGTLDPAGAHNRIITDIALADRNAEGRVAYSATFRMIKPVDMARASGLMHYFVVNRGNGQPGYYPEGHVGLVSGWQGDLPEDRPNIQTIKLPVAHNRDGSALLAPAFVRFFDMPAGTTTLPIFTNPGTEFGRNYLPATADGARLTRTSSDTAEPVDVPRADWAFADCSSRPFPGTPDMTRLCLRGGFDPKFNYNLTFMAKDPRVMGIGFAATRDLIAFLRYARADASGNANPLAGRIRWVTARGTSQSANFLRSLVHLDFNAAEDGRIVLDGILPIVGPRQLAMNLRFVNAGGAASIYQAGSEGPDWWAKHADAVRPGIPASGLLDRCLISRTCPKVIETYGAAEFWNLRATAPFVGADAKADIPLPANVRRYYYASVTHGGGNGSYDVKAARPPAACVLNTNPNPTYNYAAAEKALFDWVAKGTEPPPSLYPTLAHGDLVMPNAAAMGFPRIPGTLQPDGHINPFLAYDFGAGFNAVDLSGTPANHPPRITGSYTSLVPRVDADGNETAGVRSPMLQVPLGTYVGWNETRSGFMAGKFCVTQGGFIPFAATKGERMAAGDPRPSLEERYGTKANYLARLKTAADQLVAQRYLLREDADRTLKAAADAPIPLPP
jgi:hypothetical protein